MSIKSLRRRLCSASHLYGPLAHAWLECALWPCRLAGRGHPTHNRARKIRHWFDSSQGHNAHLRVQYSILLMKLKPLVTHSFVRDMSWVLSNIERSGDCWLWTKSSSDGYGQFVHIDPRTKIAKSYRLHRYVYQLCVSAVGREDLIRHKCGNRLCCNPKHLEVGSHLDNYHDSSYEHARATELRTARKLRAHNATLSDRTARSYRRMYSDLRMSIPDIVNASGLSHPTVLYLLRGKTYKRLGMKYTEACISRLNRERYLKAS